MTRSRFARRAGTARRLTAAVTVVEMLECRKLLSAAATTASDEPPPYNQPPWVHINEDPYWVEESATGGTTFTASGYDPEGTPLTYEWDWDFDGVTFDVDHTNAAGEAAQTTITGLDGPSNRTIAVRVTDGRGDSAYAQRYFQVVDRPPELIVDGPPQGTEAEPYTLQLSSVDAGPDVIRTWMVDWGDGTPREAFEGPAVAPQHTYDSGYPYPISVEAIDDDGVHHQRYQALHVGIAPVAPTISVTGSGVADEGSPYAMTLAATDPGDDHIYQWEIDWGDGSYPEYVNVPWPGPDAPRTPGGAAPVTVEHTYRQNTFGNAYPVRVVARDEDGTYYHGMEWDGVQPHRVTVNNVAPQDVTIVGGDRTMTEGGRIEFEGLFTDPGVDDSHSARWEVRDANGQLVPGGYYETGMQSGLQQQQHHGQPLRFSFGADDDGQYTVSLTVTDWDNESTTATVALDVAAAPPDATFVVYAPVDEGDWVWASFFDIRDPSQHDTWSEFVASYDLDGDGTFESTSRNGAGGTMQGGAPMPESGTYTARARLADADGAYRDFTAEVVVNNVAPRGYAYAGGDVAEGEPARFWFSQVQDPSHGDTLAGFTFSYDFDRDGTFDATSTAPDGSVEHAFADDGDYTVVARVADRDGGYTDREVPIGVFNTAPSVRITDGPAGPVLEGTPLTITASAVDRSSADEAAGFTYAWRVNDEIVAGATGATLSFTPADDGEYRVTVVATDKDGAPSTPAFRIVRVANAAPAVQIIDGPADAVVEGTPVTVTAAATDPSPADEAAGFTYTWRVNGDVVAGATGATLAFTPPDEGEYRVVVVAVDRDNAPSAPTSWSVRASNVAPTATFAAAAGATEGTPVVVRFADVADVPADLPGLRYSFDFNGDGDFTDAGDVANSPGAEASFAFADDGTYTVRGRVTDPAGAFTDFETTVAVAGVGPGVSIVPGFTSAKKGKPLAFTFGATDPSPADAAGRFDYVIDWGDGTTGPDRFLSGGTTVTGSHTFKSRGRYTVTAYAVDEDGLRGVATTLIVEVA